MKHRLRFLYEKRETVLLRQSPATKMAFCGDCGKTALMVTPEAVAILTAHSEREIFRLVEAGEVHFIEGPKIYICLDSLAAITGTEFKQEKLEK